MNTPFEITREEVLNLAAQKLVDSYASDDDLSEIAERQITEKINEIFATKMTSRIDGFLEAEMSRIVSTEIVPVNLWGERVGVPTTIRATLEARAKDFWEVKVDENGKESTWGTERSKRLMGQILKDTFAATVKENAEIIIAEFKKALQQDAIKLVTEHIDKLIHVKTK